MSTHPSSVHERVSASRKKYAISAVIGVVLALSWFFVAWYGLEGRYFVIVDRYLDIGDRLAYVAKWMTGPGLCLLVSVVMVANVRAFTPAIDPLETDLEEKDERAIHVWRNITTNTTEQILLLLIGTMAFAVIAPQYWLRLIPIAAVSFVAGRVIFALGYLVASGWRGTGFALTFYPIFGIYAVTLYLYFYG